MYCRKCGAKQFDDAVFCSECGTKLVPDTQPESARPAEGTAARQTGSVNISAVPPAVNRISPAPTATNMDAPAPVAAGMAAAVPSGQKRKYRLIGIAAVVVVVVILATTGFLIFGGRSYRSVLKQFADGIEQLDADKIIETLPEQYLGDIMEQIGYDSIREGKEGLQEEMDMEQENRENFEDWKLSYEVDDIDDFSKEELDEFKDSLDGTALEDMKIKALKTASLEFTLKHSEGEETREMDVLLGKIGRSWYVINWQNL